MAKRTETNYIVIHCSATAGSQDIGVKEIRRWHKARGWSDVGYHLIIRRSGAIEFGRHMDDVGAHVSGHNRDSVGICLVGGLLEDGSSDFANNGGFTLEQLLTLKDTLRVFEQAYPSAKIVGHRDFSPDLNNNGEIEVFEYIKDCPVMDVAFYLNEYNV